MAAAIAANPSNFEDPDKALREWGAGGSTAATTAATAAKPPPPQPSQTNIKQQVHKIDDGIYSTPSAAASSSAGPSKAKSKQKQQPPKMNPGVQDEIIAGGVQVEPVAPQQGRGRPKRSTAAKPVNYTEDEVYATPPQTGAGRRRKR